jgi:hypothetical protein
VGTGNPVAVYTDTRKFSKITIAADGQTLGGAAVPGALGAINDLVQVYCLFILRTAAGSRITLLFNFVNHFKSH